MTTAFRNAPFESAAPLDRGVPVDLDLADLEDEEVALRTLPPASESSMLAVPDIEVWKQHVHYERCHDDTTRQLLFEHYEPYARRLARSLFRHGSESIDELTQVASEALLLAIDRFHTDRRLPFEAFARPTIIGSLKRHYRDQGWTIRVPRRVHEIAGPAREATERLTQELRRDPQPGEVADALDVDPDLVAAASLATLRRTPRPMDARIGDPAGEDGWSQLGVVDQSLARVDELLGLADAVEGLDDSDRRLLTLYYFDELTQSEIGHRLGCSQMQVSRRLDRIIRRLRTRVTA